ncbi:hypothetical protein LTR78_003370 [Recurvomyces mirabilis]|uniref:N-acetyltransferase domain-containing protein n=1 Tax=Recurvomyces mirabilis TaxID=574656 RepID=A0AAE0WRI8_9PEZI|nr:hypothetical protein LTR78_003370 [Recurvomyces mirabilis]KAK5154594.1 hypothetical protein LTS14_006732 [Recurvomyces mirabilis]
MAVDSDQPQNGTLLHSFHQANGVLPGTTISTAPQPKHPVTTISPPQTQPGRPINSKETTLTLYEPPQLVGNPILLPLRDLINHAFDTSHTSHAMFSTPRLSTPEYYLESLGSDPGTFAYILTDNKTGTPIATAGAHRYVAPVFEATTSEQKRTFARVQLPSHITHAISTDPQTEIWELKLMAVAPSLQGQGLARYLMDLVDQEVVRQVRAEGRGRAGGSGKLFMLITTLKEINGEFYARRGYGFDYETVHEEGWMGSKRGFGVVHMSKKVPL